MSRTISWALTGVSVALLLAVAYTGIAGGIDQFDQTSHTEYTVGQIIQTVLQLVFGVLSVAVIAVWFWARPWSPAQSLRAAMRRSRLTRARTGAGR